MPASDAQETPNLKGGCWQTCHILPWRETLFLLSWSENTSAFFPAGRHQSIFQSYLLGSYSLERWNRIY